MGITPLRGPIGRLRNAVLAGSPTGSCSAAPSKIADQMFRDCTAGPLPFPVLDWPRSRRGDRAVHRGRVRVPALRRSRHPALRRADLRLRLAGAAARRGGPSSTARGPSSTSPRARSRTGTTASSSAPTLEGTRRRRPARRRLDRRPPDSTRCRHCPRTPAPPSSCPTTSFCRGPTSTSPTAGTAACSTPCATACRSSRPAATRTSPRSSPASPGPASGAASGPRPLHRPPSAAPYAACSQRPRYRDAARRIAHADGGHPRGRTDSPRSSTSLISNSRRTGPVQPA